MRRIIFTSGWTVAVFASLLILTTVRLEAQVQLKYRYEPGQTRQYELKQTLKTASDAGGQTAENHVIQKLKLSTAIKSVEPDGSARLAKTIDRIQMEATQPGSRDSVSFDSESPGAVSGPFGRIAQSLAQLVDQQIQMTVSERGEVGSVEIPGALKQQLSNGGAGLSGLSSSEGVEKMLSQGSVVFPDRALKRGDTWTRELSTDLPFGTMKSTVVFTYSGRTQDGMERIDAVTKISLSPNPNTPFQIDMQAADGEGVYLFDPKRGCILASGLKQEMDLELNAVGQSLKQTVTTEISMRLIR